MASYIKTLKEDNGDITYPQTLASAVFIGNSDVETEMGKYVTAEDIASTSAITPVISTSMIQDEAVTNSKVDWTTLPQSSSTNSSYVKIGDILIQYGQESGLLPTTDSTINFPQSFANTNYTLTVTGQFNEGGESFWWAFVKSKTTTSFTVRGGYKVVNSSGGGGNAAEVCNWIAIGKAA